MSASKAAYLHAMARSLEESADIARWQVGAYEMSVTAVEGMPTWERFVSLTRRAQALSRETGQVLDALAAEAEAIAVIAEGHTP